MFSWTWHTFFFDPVYNALVFFVDVVPYGDVGVAIIFTTIVVRVILLPLSLKAARTQYVMREIEPKLKELKEKFKDKREEQARAMMELYRKSGVNPFSSILLLFIQIPIIIALYLSVYSGGGIRLPEINTALLYSFIPSPEMVSMIFLGIIDVAGRSLPLAALAGITQYIHTNLSLPKQQPRDKDAEPNFKDDFARSMQLQMRYVMPILIFVVAYTISAAIALYFLVSNIISIGQEYIVRHQGLKPPQSEKK
jgi:YidC/Oxa1 family membrane protein insertase